MKNLLFGVVLIIFVSCSPKLTITSSMKSEKISKVNKCDYIFGKNETVPDSSIVVAEFRTKGNFFTSMNFRVNQSINLIQKGITDLNYSVIKIEEIKFPGPFKSKSYDIKGEILLLKKCPIVKGRLVNEITDVSKKYVKLYRPNRLFGSGISFPIYLNEQFLCGLDNDSKRIIEIDSESNINLQVESYGERFTIPLDFYSNDQIFIRCDVNDIGRPKTTFENNELGNKNFNKIKNMR